MSPLYNFCKNLRSLRLKSLAVLFLCFSVILLQFPPIYFIGYENALLTTHSLVRYGIVLFFLSKIVEAVYTKKNDYLSLSNYSVHFVLLFFLAQSISIINASNLAAYLSTYKDITFGFLTFLLTLFFINKKNVHLLIRALLLAGIGNIIFEFLIYFHTPFVLQYLTLVVHDKYWLFFEYQTNRNRFFGDMFDAPLIPLLFFYLSTSKSLVQKIFPISYIGFISFFTFLSNWRTKIIIWLFSIISAFFTTFTIYKKQLTTFAIVICAIFFFAVTAHNVSYQNTGFSVINRFFSPDEIQDVKSVTNRFNYWHEAVSIAFKNPLFGVGLGNYYDNAGLPEKKYAILFQKFNPIDNPHSIFFSTLAETGFTGFVALILIILYFIKIDFAHFIQHKNKSIKHYLIISFWTTFLYSTINPSLFFNYQFLFWLLRGLVERSEATND